MYLHLMSLMALFLAEQPKEIAKMKIPSKPLPTVSAVQTTLKHTVNSAVPTTLKPTANSYAQDCVDSRLRVGRCIPLTQCPDIVEEFYNEARQTSYGVDFQTFISNSICGFDGTTFLICCRTPQGNMAASQMHTSSIIFGSTSSPVAPQTQSNVFLFAPLGGNAPPVTSAPNINPMATQPSLPPASYPNTNPIIFQPTGQNPMNPMVTPPPTVFQQVPGQVPVTTPSGGLIYQPAPNPLGTPMPITPQPNPMSGVWDNMACGITKGTTNRVVGGGEARKGAYPWMAALGFRDEYSPSTLKYLCGGSLISQKYVITSAHCINANLILVRLGAHDLSNVAEASAVDYRIKRTVQHEGFDLKTIVNDIALIELAQPVTMTNFISHICLPEATNFLTQDFVGMNPFVAGWGATQHQGITSNVLRDAQVPIVSRQTCEQSYRTVFKFVEFSDKLICAGSSNVDACQGDSGGPLMLPQMDGLTFRYYLLGIVSYGYECARSGFPGVYTRVAMYLPWIKQNMI